jgi:hypothetical protein
MEQGPDSLHTKAEIVNYVKESFANLHIAVDLLDEKNPTIKSSPISPLQGGSATRHAFIVEALLNDEQEEWRVRSGAKATGHVRGNVNLKSALHFVRFEPFVVPKRSLTGDSTERVDTRVRQVIYRVESNDMPLFVARCLHRIQDQFAKR